MNKITIHSVTRYGWNIEGQADVDTQTRGKLRQQVCYKDVSLFLLFLVKDKPEVFKGQNYVS